MRVLGGAVEQRERQQTGVGAPRTNAEEAVPRLPVRAGILLCFVLCECCLFSHRHCTMNPRTIRHTVWQLCAALSAQTAVCCALRPRARLSALCAQCSFPLVRDTSTAGVFRYQPVDEIRNYFGEQVALYFSWLGVYTQALIALSFFGIVTMAFQPAQSEGGVNANPLTLAYSVLLSLWSVAFLSAWKRRETEVRRGRRRFLSQGRCSGIISHPHDRDYNPTRWP